MKPGPWIAKARDFGRIIRDSVDHPITLMIGAGCSISSGCPPTIDVHHAFEQATKGRSGDEEIRAFLEEIKQIERQRIITPLFRNIKPYIGYRCLAALARIRRIHILNLNWDPLVQIACDAAGVECVSFDLRNRSKRKIESLPAGRGIACVHVHGELKGSCRYSVLETRTFDHQESKFLRRHFLSHPFAIIGTSLQNDMDFEAFFRENAHGQRNHALWYFGRGWSSDESESNRLAQEWMHRLGCQPREFCVRPSVDFDQFMLTVLEEVKDLRWDDWVTKSSARLPRLDELVPVRPELIRDSLDAPALAFVGHPRLGKTVIAEYLTHCFRLWSSGPIDVRRFDRPAQSAAAFAGADQAGSPEIVFLVQDPFGSTERFEENPRFFEEIARVLKPTQTGQRPRILMTSRGHAWQKALARYSSQGSSIVTISAKQTDWYRSEDLEHIPDLKEVIVAKIQQGELRTPGDVLTEMRQQRLMPADQRRDTTQTDAARETLAILTLHPDAGLFCALIRLQSFCSSLHSEEELLAAAGLQSVPPAAYEFVHRYDFEGSPRIKLDHGTTVEAVDQFLLRESSAVSDQLSKTLYPRHPLFRALSAWKLLSAEPDPATASRAADLQRWGAAFFAAKPTFDRLELSLNSATDQWALTEIAYELVRVWEDLPPTEHRSRLLDQILADRHKRRAYALFEACLYLQAAAPEEVLDRVRSEAWRLISQTGNVRESTLLVDGWMWRPLPGGRLPAWIDGYFKGLDPASPEWAFVRFLMAFHSDGFSALGPAYAERDATVQWTQEQADFASWLVQWHFSHQAHSRVLLSRQRPVDKDYLCRTLHTPVGGPPIRAIIRFINSMGAFPELVGWAFHIGCNAACTFGNKEPDLLDEVRSLTSRLPPVDAGTITAAVTFDSAKHFQEELRDYFRSPANRSALLNVLRDGLEIDAITLKPPRFMFARDPSAVYDLLDLRWPNLDIKQVAIGNPRTLAQEVWTLAQPEIQRAKIPRSAVDQLSAEIEMGDLRQLEECATAGRGSHGSALQQILDIFAQKVAAFPLFHP